MISAKSFSKAGNLAGKDTFIYNIPGYLIKENQFDSTGQLAYISEYIYDSSNRVHQVNKSDASQNSVSSIKNEYDSKGNLIAVYKKENAGWLPVSKFEFDKEAVNSSSRYYEQNDSPDVFLNTYDKNRNLSFSHSKNEYVEITIKYTYDKRNRCTRRTYQMKGRIPKVKPVSTIETFSYYPDDLLYEKLYFENHILSGKLKCFYTFYE